MKEHQILYQKTVPAVARFSKNRKEALITPGYNSLRMRRNNFSEAEFDALSFAAVSETIRSLEMCFFDDLVFFAASPPESVVPGPLPLHAGFDNLSLKTKIGLGSRFKY